MLQMPRSFVLVATLVALAGCGGRYNVGNDPNNGQSALTDAGVSGDACGPNAACGPRLVCMGGTCKPQGQLCDANTACPYPSEQKCDNGVCLFWCSGNYPGTICAPGETCAADELCRPATTTDAGTAGAAGDSCGPNALCGARLVCMAGTCKPQGQLCDANTPCPYVSQQKCDNGVCRFWCSPNYPGTICAPGESCQPDELCKP